MNFSDLGLAQPLLKALESEGYTTPTPIQLQAIPPVMAGSDLLGIAQTGTGKTAAFALPILHRLTTDPRPPQRRGCRVLVITPTRELASQIAESFRVYGQHIGVSVAVIFGGVAMRPQITTLSRGVDVVVATPGRLLDHIGERTIVLTGTEVLVLDEVDQMLDLGFIKPIRRITAQLTAKRQNLFFSATMPKEIAGLADVLLTNPVKVTVAPVASTAERVEQRVIHVEAKGKNTLLVELAADPEMTRTLVFARTKRGSDRITKHLIASGIPAASIHGNKSQRQREESLLAFRKGKIRVLVATDIAARGIDIDGVSHVVNFELPDVPEAYVHRIGRTARAGATGKATAFCDPAERDKLRAIERLIRQTIPSEDRRGRYAATVDISKDDRPRRPAFQSRDRNRSDDRRGDRSAARPANREGPPNRQPASRDDRREPARADRREGDRRPQREAGHHAPTGGHRAGPRAGFDHAAAGHAAAGHAPQRDGARPDRRDDRREPRRDDRRDERSPPREGAPRGPRAAGPSGAPHSPRRSDDRRETRSGERPAPRQSTGHSTGRPPNRADRPDDRRDDRRDDRPAQTNRNGAPTNGNGQARSQRPPAKPWQARPQNRDGAAPDRNRDGAKSRTSSTDRDARRQTAGPDRNGSRDVKRPAGPRPDNRSSAAPHKPSGFKRDRRPSDSRGTAT